MLELRGVVQIKELGSHRVGYVLCTVLEWMRGGGDGKRLEH